MLVNPINSSLLKSKLTQNQKFNVMKTKQENISNMTSFGASCDDYRVYDALAAKTIFKQISYAASDPIRRLIQIHQDCKAIIIPTISEILAEIRTDLAEKCLPIDEIPIPYSCERPHLIGPEEFTRIIKVDDQGLLRAKDEYFDSQTKMGPAHLNAKKWTKVVIKTPDAKHPLETTTFLPSGEILFKIKPPFGDTTIFRFPNERTAFPCVIRRMTQMRDGYVKVSDLYCLANGHNIYDPNPKISPVDLSAARK